MSWNIYNRIVHLLCIFQLLHAHLFSLLQLQLNACQSWVGWFLYYLLNAIICTHVSWCLLFVKHCLSLSFQTILCRLWFQDKCASCHSVRERLSSEINTKAHVYSYLIKANVILTITAWASKSLTTQFWMFIRRMQSKHSANWLD